MTKPQTVQFVTIASGSSLSSSFAVNGKELALLVPFGFPVTAAMWLKVAGSPDSTGNSAPNSASFARLDYDHVSSLSWNVTTGGVPRALNLKDLATPFKYAMIEVSAALTRPTSIQVFTRL